MSAKKLKIAVLSDLHLGHRRVDTEHILDNLRKALPDNAETAELDIVFLAGDVFDSLLNLSDECVFLIELWIIEVLRLCKKYDIMLRVLEGTHSHDWKQSEHFDVLNRGTKINADLAYVQELFIEYIPRHDITVLYVPDDLNTDTNVTLSQVRELMTIKGLTKVDYAIMHGQFEYQLPEIVKAPKHPSKEYLEIVDKLIFIGHIHVFSTFERIVAQGSFDRLSHGEEEPKGHVRADIEEDGTYKVRFVENEGAKKFITLECRGLTLLETLEEIELKSKDVPDESFVRILCLPDNPILREMDHLTRMRPLITWSKLIKEEKTYEVDEDREDPFQEDFVPINITPDNIVRLVMDRLRNKPLSPALFESVERVITEAR